MKVYLGADHRGFKLKESLKKYLKLNNYDVVDVGAEVFDIDDDYVDYAKSVCEQMSEGDRGILICGSGHGVCMTANRYKKIRGVLGFNLDVAVQGREDEDANVLSIPADWISEDEASEMAKVFLETKFSGEERHIRRLKKIKDIF